MFKTVPLKYTSTMRKLKYDINIYQVMMLINYMIIFLQFLKMKKDDDFFVNILSFKKLKEKKEKKWKIN